MSRSSPPPLPIEPPLLLSQNRSKFAEANRHPSGTRRASTAASITVVIPAEAREISSAKRNPAPPPDPVSIPLRIFHTERSTQWGGQELRTLIEVEAANAAGHLAWAIVNQGGKMEEYARRRGTPHYAIPMRSSIDPRGLLELGRLVRRHRPTIICSHNAQDFYLAFPYARLLGIPLVRYRHISNPVKPTFSRNFAFRHGADAVITSGRGTAQMLIEQNGAPPDRTFVHPAGVDLRRFDPGRADGANVRAAFGLQPGHLVIGQVGMIRSDKGVHVLLDAAKRLGDEFPRVRFLIVGGPTRLGEYLAEMLALRQRLDLESKVVFTGHREDVPDCLAAMDIAVLASVGVDAQPQAVQQAFAMGLPMVGTNIGGIPELIHDGRTGLLAPPNDPAALAAAIRRFILDPALRQRCAQAARAHALAHLDFDHIMAEIFDLYRTIIANRRQRRGRSRAA